MADRPWTPSAVLLALLGCTAPNPAYLPRALEDAAVEADTPEADAVQSNAVESGSGDVSSAPMDTPVALLDAGPDAAVVRPDAGVDRPADAAPAPDVAVPMGTGLRGDYFDGTDLEMGNSGSLNLRRVDATIDFDWADGRPFGSVDDDYFSVRWTGQVMPLFSESYTFSTVTDEGVRLWVNGVQLIDRWVNQVSTSHSGSITLVAYRKYDIRMEYFEATLKAVAKLYWSSPTQRMEIVPRACLFPPP